MIDVNAIPDLGLIAGVRIYAIFSNRLNGHSSRYYQRNGRRLKGEMRRHSLKKVTSLNAFPASLGACLSPIQSLLKLFQRYCQLNGMKPKESRFAESVLGLGSWGQV